MAELGPDTESLHSAVGDRLRDAEVEVISVGVTEYGGSLVDEISEVPHIIGPLSADTAILIKASRVAELERLVPLLP